mmetsp:Transcript_21773/g.32543  ORF Transcript_21773/g.32543 Transcript_21773/m.32543 type:complete len:299 (-) Transcript_21773:119-1015(-)
MANPMNSLHQYICEKNWTAVEIELCMTSSSRRQLRETFDGDLPIHMALKNCAPENIMLKIIESHRHAVLKKTREGDLPLHLCCKFGASATVIQAIILEDPSALTVKSNSSSGTRMTVRDLVKDNARLLDDDAVSTLAKPMKHWTRILEGKRTGKKQKVEQLQQTLFKVRQDLAGTRASEAILLERLGKLHQTLHSYDESTKSTIENLEEIVEARINEGLADVTAARRRRRRSSLSTATRVSAYRQHFIPEREKASLPSKKSEVEFERSTECDARTRRVSLGPAVTFPCYTKRSSFEFC